MPSARSRRLPRAVGRPYAKRHLRRIFWTVRPWRLDGLTWAECCDRLNAAGERTFRGERWTPGRLAQVAKAGRIEAIDHAVLRRDYEEVRTCLIRSRLTR